MEKENAAKNGTEANSPELAANEQAKSLSDSHSHQSNPGPPGHIAAKIGYRREIGFRRIAKLYLIRGLKVGGDRWFELAVLFVVGLVAIFQLITTIGNNKGTTQQADQLIAAAKYSAYAAKQNLQAARDFSDSARSISIGVDDAVNKLRDQANATERARATAEEDASNALKATIDNFHQEQRANVHVGRPVWMSETKRAVFTIFNTGRTTSESGDSVIYELTGHHKTRHGEFVTEEGHWIRGLLPQQDPGDSDFALYADAPNFDEFRVSHQSQAIYIFITLNYGGGIKGEKPFFRNACYQLKGEPNHIAFGTCGLDMPLSSIQKGIGYPGHEITQP